ncbi:MAG: hypothetical protein ABI377_03170, partial [Devosia sp.]
MPKISPEFSVRRTAHHHGVCRPGRKRCDTTTLLLADTSNELRIPITRNRPVALGCRGQDSPRQTRLHPRSGHASIGDEHAGAHAESAWCGLAEERDRPRRQYLAGYWEPTLLNALNDEMLIEAGSRWDDWRAFDPASLPPGRGEYYRAEITRIVREEYGDEPLFVLKEPRISRFAPLYADILEAMNIDVRYVLATRNPLEVMASLAARDNLTPSFSALLWLGHELEAERATRGKPRAFVSYGAMIENWRRELARIARTLQLEWPRSIDASANDINAHISPQHRHHQAAPASLVADDDRAVYWAKEAYAALTALKSDTAGRKALATLDKVRAEFDAVSGVVGTAFFAELGARQKMFADELAKSARQVEAAAAEQARLLTKSGKLQGLADDRAAEITHLTTNAGQA